MLDKIRKFSKSWVFKILFGALIAAFMLSGISSSVYQATQDNYFVKVGKDKIYQSEIDKKYSDMLHEMRAQGIDYTDEQFAAIGVSKQQVLQSMIQKSLIAQEVAKLELSVSDEIVKGEIAKIPYLQKNGKYDVEALRLTLYHQGIREKQFIENVRGEIAANILQRAVLQQIPQSNFLVEKALEASVQKRDVEFVVVPAGYDKIEAEPTEEELKTFYEENGIDFQTPETRKFEYIMVPKDANKATLYDKVAKLEDALAGGAKFAEVAKKQGLKYAMADNVEKDDDQFSDKFADIAFSAEQGSQSGVIEDKDGSYFTINVLQITDSKIPDLAEIKPQIIAEWKKDKQKKRDIVFANEMLEKARTGGNLQLVADEYGLPLQKIHGLSRKDTEKYDPDFVAAAFETAEGKLFDEVFDDGKGGFKISRLSKINVGVPSDTDRQQYAEQNSRFTKNDILSQYFEYLRGKYPVKLNPKAPKL